MLVLITYDVNTETAEGKTRLRKVAKQCVNYGRRVQNSVFECVVTEVQYKLLYNNLQQIIQKETDSIRFYFMGKNWERHIVTLGRDESLNISSTLII